MYERKGSAETWKKRQFCSFYNFGRIGKSVFYGFIELMKGEKEGTYKGKYMNSFWRHVHFPSSTKQKNFIFANFLGILGLDSNVFHCKVSSKN